MSVGLSTWSDIGIGYIKVAGAQHFTLRSNIVQLAKRWHENPMYKYHLHYIGPI